MPGQQHPQAGGRPAPAAGQGTAGSRPGSRRWRSRWCRGRARCPRSAPRRPPPAAGTPSRPCAPGSRSPASSVPPARTTSPGAKPGLAPTRCAGSTASTGAPVSSASRRRPAGVVHVAVGEHDRLDALARAGRGCPDPAQVALVVRRAGVHDDDRLRARLGDQPGVGAVQRHQGRIRGQNAACAGGSGSVDAGRLRLAHSGYSKSAGMVSQAAPSARLDLRQHRPDLARPERLRHVAACRELGQAHRGRRPQEISLPGAPSRSRRPG